MKVLVCGSSGILGRELCKTLLKNNIEFVGTYNKNIIQTEKYVKADINNINDIITEYNPDVIVNCIVNRIVDECEEKWNEIKKINVDFVDKLLSHNIKLIHISTDYIFDGLKSPYTPEDLANPKQNYGISKYLAELRILNKTDNYIIIRVPVLFTDNYKNLNESAVTSIGKNIMDLTINDIYEDAICIRRPVYIPIFCNFIYDCIMADYKGIYHFYNPVDKFTKYEISNIIAEILNKSSDNVLPNFTNNNRPLDTQLNDKKYDINKYYINYNFKDLIKKCFNKFSHPRYFKECFLMIDLDGTLVDTEEQHYISYNKIINMTREDFNDKNQKNILDLPELLKNEKNKIFESLINDIKLMNNTFTFIKFLLKNNINFVVVTNTSARNVELYKEKLPILKNIKNWVVKDDYKHKKPDPEAYLLAKKKYYNNEKYIIGIENTIAGYDALKNITDIIYINVNDNTKSLFKNKDVYLFNDFSRISQ